jgi:hypothetical protein
MTAAEPQELSQTSSAAGGTALAAEGESSGLGETPFMPPGDREAAADEAAAAGGKDKGNNGSSSGSHLGAGVGIRRNRSLRPLRAGSSADVADKLVPSSSTSSLKGNFK